MGLRSYLILMAIGTILCWVVWFLIIGNINPDQAGIIGLILFYLSLFLSLTGTISVVGFLIRKKIDKNDTVVFHHVRHTFRQGLLLSCLIISALILLQCKILNWLTGMLVVVLFLIIESIIFANRKHKNKI